MRLLLRLLLMSGLDRDLPWKERRKIAILSLIVQAVQKGFHYYLKFERRFLIAFFIEDWSIILVSLSWFLATIIGLTGCSMEEAPVRCLTGGE